jgi:hypothetical protein
VEEWRKNTMGTSGPKEGCFIKLDFKGENGKVLGEGRWITEEKADKMK